MTKHFETLSPVVCDMNYENSISCDNFVSHPRLSLISALCELLMKNIRLESDFPILKWRRHESIPFSYVAIFVSCVFYVSMCVTSVRVTIEFCKILIANLELN